LKIFKKPKGICKQQGPKIIRSITTSTIVITPYVSIDEDSIHMKSKNKMRRSEAQRNKISIPYIVVLFHIGSNKRIAKHCGLLHTSPIPLKWLEQVGKISEASCTLMLHHPLTTS
jgi:hypothetical protein